MTDPADPCPNCGNILQYGKSIVFGCEKCYIHFEKFLLPIIAKLQDGNTRHEGKIPFSAVKKEELKRRMREAVKIEDYEAAAKLRDILNKKDT